MKIWFVYLVSWRLPLSPREPRCNLLTAASSDTWTAALPQSSKAINSGTPAGVAPGDVLSPERMRDMLFGAAACQNVRRCLPLYGDFM